MASQHTTEIVVQPAGFECGYGRNQVRICLGKQEVSFLLKSLAYWKGMSPCGLTGFVDRGVLTSDVASFLHNAFRVEGYESTAVCASASFILLQCSPSLNFLPSFVSKAAVEHFDSLQICFFCVHVVNGSRCKSCPSSCRYSIIFSPFFGSCTPSLNECQWHHG